MAELTPTITATGNTEIVLSTQQPLTKLVDVGFLPHKTNQSSVSKFHGLVYGGIGVGKTYTLVSTSPFTTYLMDCGRESAGLDEFDHVYYEKVRSYYDVCSRAVYLGSTLQKFPDSIGLLIVDNLTEMQRFLLRGVCGADVPEKRHWGMVLNQMEVIIATLQELPCHVVFVAHEHEWNNMFSPYLDGQLKTRILGLFSNIGRFVYLQEEVKNSDNVVTSLIDKRFIQWRMSARVQARNCGGKLETLEWADIGATIQKYQTPRITTQ